MENTTATVPVNISSKYEPNNDNLIVEEIIKTYENHPSIKLIKYNVLSEDKDFTIESATAVKLIK